LAVLVLDRAGRHLFRRGAVQAGDIDGIEGAAQRIHMAAAERLDAAVPAEEMVNVFRAELVIGKIVLALQDAEVILARDRLPEPALGAHRTIAPAAALGRIEPAFETDGAAVTSALMELFHVESPRS
jgi:hypothetical protein